MEVVKAKCIKETYTWDGDGKQHKFPYVKNGLIYVFNIEVRSAHEKIYWLNKSLLPNPHDFEFIDYCQRGLEEKNFKEMFEIQ